MVCTRNDFEKIKKPQIQFSIVYKNIIFFFKYCLGFGNEYVCIHWLWDPLRFDIIQTHSPEICPYTVLCSLHFLALASKQPTLFWSFLHRTRIFSQSSV